MVKSASMSEAGDSVDYTKVKDSEPFADYLKLVKQLKLVDMGNLSQNERKAFLINLYNSLVIHAIIAKLLGSGSQTDRVKMYATAAYNIGNCVYSLNDIENGLLR